MKHRLAPWILFIVVLSFYLYTLQPSLGWGDSARLQGEAITGVSLVPQEILKDEKTVDPWPFPRLGIGAWDHPLWIILAHTIAHGFPTLDRLWLVNLVSAVFGAAAITLLFQLVLAHTDSLPAALLAAGSLAVSHTFWFHAVVAEVYTLFAFLLLAGIYLHDFYERSHWRPALAGCLLALGLGMSNHLLTALAFPAFLLYSWWAKRVPRKITLPTWQILAGGLAFLAGFSIFLFQFARLLRSIPAPRLLRQALGISYISPLLTTLTLPVLVKSLFFFLMYLGLQFGPLVLLGLLGFVVGRRPFPYLWAKSAAFYAVFALFGVIYRVDDQFAFLLPSYLFWSLATGMGIAHLLSTIRTPLRRGIVAALAALVLLMPLFYHYLPGLLRQACFSEETFGIPIVGSTRQDGLAYYVDPSKRGSREAYLFGRQTMSDLPPGAVVIAPSAIDADVFFVLRYFSEVEGLRPDVNIIGWPLSNPYAMDKQAVAARIELELIHHRSVYLASLNSRFIDAEKLEAHYCIVPQAYLYRVYPNDPQMPGITRPGCIEIRSHFESVNVGYNLNLSTTTKVI